MKVFTWLFHKKSSMSSISSNSLFIVSILLLLALFWAGHIYLSGLLITGPFIFGDEATYFSFARYIFHHKSLNGFTQYGPLYPALLSFFFYFKNVILIYNIVKILNIIIYFSAVIPGYLLSKELFTNKWIRMLLPLCIILSPFSGFVYLVWADPLYFSLFYWSCFLLYRYINKPTLVKGVLFGLFLSSLYYTKPGAGFIVQIAAFLSLVIYSLLLWKSQSPRTRLLTAATIFTCLAADLPWVLHYHHLGFSIIGYASVTNSLNWRVAHEGYSILIVNTIRSFFYQFSYVFIGTCGLIGIGLVLLFKKWQQLNFNERIIGIFAMLCIFGLMALSAGGMTAMSGLDYRMPNGRYLSVLLPLVTTLSLYFLIKIATEKKSARFLLFIIFITMVITVIATPLYTRSPFAFTTMPELSPIIYLSDHGGIIWRSTIDTPSLFLRLSVAIFFGLFAFCMLLFRKWMYMPLLAMILIALGYGFGSITEIRGMSTIGIGGPNNVYRYIKENNIEPSQIAFDKDMEVGNVQFLSSFWLDQLPQYINHDEINKNAAAKSISYFVSCDPLTLNNRLYSSFGCAIYGVSIKEGAQ